MNAWNFISEGFGIEEKGRRQMVKTLTDGCWRNEGVMQARLSRKWWWKGMAVRATDEEKGH